MPELDADEMLTTYYPSRASMLRASQVPQEIAMNADGYQYSRVGANHAQAAGIDVELCTSGYDYDYMAQEIAGQVPKSATDGEAGFGNNYGKRSLDKTYIADAMGTGLLTILSLTQVTKIARASDGDYVVSCREIDIDGKCFPSATCRAAISSWAAEAWAHRSSWCAHASRVRCPT